MSLILPAIVTVVAPLLTGLTWFLSRRHRETIEDSDAMAVAIAAVTDANVSITGVVTSLMAPMQQEMERLRKSELETRSMVDRLERQFSAAITHIRVLHRMLRSEQIEFPPMPEELGHIDLH